MQSMWTRVVRNFACIIATGFAPVLAIAAYELELPEAPDGFEWTKIERIKAALLVPDGWHFKAEKKKDRRRDLSATTVYQSLEIDD